MRDVYIAMSYGLFPFCVQEDKAGTHLVFRRVNGPNDSKDRRTGGRQRNSLPPAAPL